MSGVFTELPPSSVEMERQALGAALISTRAAGLVAEEPADPRAWYYGPHGAIQAAVRSLITRELAVNTKTVIECLTQRGELDRAGGQAYLLGLEAECGVAAHIETYLEVIGEKHARRSLIEAGHTIQGLGYDEGQPVDDVFSAAEATLYQASRRRARHEFLSASELAVRRVDASGSPPTPSIATGYPTLDRTFAGWKKERLYIIAGRPGSGKTAFIVNLARNAVKAGARPGIFSLETPADDLWTRLLAIEGRLDVAAIERDNLGTDDQAELARANGRLADSPLWIWDGCDPTMLSLRGHARRVQRKHNVNVLFIDYLQLIQPEGRGEADVRHFTRVADGLKMMARELQVPVIALSQLSRKVEDRKPPRPILTDIRESGGIEQAADFVMMIYRPNFYLRQAGEDTPGPDETELIIAKHRNGPVGACKLLYWPEQTAFTEIETRHSEADAPPERQGYRD